MAVKGIRQIFFCKKDTLYNVTPTYGTAVGLSTDGKLTFEDVPVVDYREGDLPDKVNHKVEAKSKQITFVELDRLINYFSLEGCDLQVVTEKETAAASGGVYNYSGEKRFMGFDFEYLISSKDRSANLNFEVSMDYKEHNYLLQDALIAGQTGWIHLEDLGLGYKGVDPAKYRNPNFEHFKHPDPTVLVNGHEIVDRKLTIKSVSSKLEYDRSDLNWFNINIELTVNKTKASDLVDHFTKSRYASISIAEKVSPTIIEKFNFGEGVLWRKHMVEIGKDKRDIKFTFNRNITPFDISINTTTNILTVNEL